MTCHSKDWEELAILQELRQQQRQAEMIARFMPKSPRRCVEFERSVTERVIPRLAEFGQVNLTTHSAPFDLFVGGCRVELKAANWVKNNRGRGRYAASVRNRQADILLFVAVNGRDHYFVIPMTEITVSGIAITSYDVNTYRGQWADYLEAWDVLASAVASVPPLPVQTSFLDKMLLIEGPCPKKGGEYG